MHASRPPIVRRRSRGYWRVKAVAGPNEILRRLEAVERGLAAVWRNSVPLIRDEVTPKTRRQMAEADREIRRGKVVPIHVSPGRIGKHKEGA